MSRFSPQDPPAASLATAAQKAGLRLGALPKEPGERKNAIVVRIRQLIQSLSETGQLDMLSQLLIPPFRGAPLHLSLTAKREMLKDLLALPAPQADELLWRLWKDLPSPLRPDLLWEPACPPALLRKAVRETTPSDWSLVTMTAQKKEELAAVFLNAATPPDVLEEAADGVLAQLGTGPVGRSTQDRRNARVPRPPEIPQELWADLLRHPHLAPVLRQRIVRAIYRRGATAHRAVVESLVPANPGESRARLSSPARIPACDVRTAVRLIELRRHLVASEWSTPVIRLVARRLLTEVLQSTDDAEPKGLLDPANPMSRVPLAPSDVGHFWRAINDDGPAEAQAEADRLLVAGLVRLPFDFLPRDTAGAGLFADATRQQALLENRALWKRLLQSATREERVRALQLLGQWEQHADVSASPLL